MLRNLSSRISSFLSKFETGFRIQLIHSFTICDTTCGIQNANCPIRRDKAETRHYLRSQTKRHRTSNILITTEQLKSGNRSRTTFDSVMRARSD